MAGFADHFRKQELADHLTDADHLVGRTCLVTGANRGLGFAIATEFARRGGRVLMACRSDIPGAGERVKELSKSQKVEMLPVDLSDVDAIRAFCAQLKERGETLDVVVLNAGVTPPTSNHTRQGQDRMFAVNYLANVILTRRLLASGVIPNETAGNRARKPPRIIFISSDSHQGASAIDFDEFGSTAPYGVTKAIHNYSYFKLVLNTYATELSRRLNRDGRVDVSVNVICPGPVNTDIIRDAPFLLRLVLRGIFTLVFQPPAKAALPVAFLAAAKEMAGTTNEYLHMFNKKRMDEKCYDARAGALLWQRSMELWSRIDRDLPEDRLPHD